MTIPLTETPPKRTLRTIPMTVDEALEEHTVDPHDCCCAYCEGVVYAARYAGYEGVIVTVIDIERYRVLAAEVRRLREQLTREQSARDLADTQLRVAIGMLLDLQPKETT